MPSRILRDYTDSQRFDGIPAEAERLFVRLLMKADDYGRYHADPRLLKAGCFPLCDHLRANDLTRWLDELSHRQLILRYEVAGRNYLAIANFGQRLRLTRAKFPAPDGQPADYLPTYCNSPQFATSGGHAPPDADPDSDSSLDSESTSDSSPDARATSLFSRFWEEYPKRVGKGNAEKAWKACKCDVIADKIVAAVQKCRNSFDWKKEGGQYIPHPATWLNRRGWEDELKPAVNPGGTPRESLQLPIATI